MRRVGHCRRELELRDAEAKEQEAKYANLQDAADEKTRKLDKLRAKKEEAHDKYIALQDEIRAEREDMLEAIRDLTKHLKLDDTIIQHFVPEQEVGLVEKRARWDEQLDNWVLAPLSLSADGGGASLLEPRPKSVSVSGAVRPSWRRGWRR